MIPLPNDVPMMLHDYHRDDDNGHDQDDDDAYDYHHDDHDCYSVPFPRHFHLTMIPLSNDVPMLLHDYHRDDDNGHDQDDDDAYDYHHDDHDCYSVNEWGCETGYDYATLGVCHVHDSDDDDFDHIAHIAVHRDVHDADDDVVDHIAHIAVHRDVHDSNDLDAFHIARDAEDLGDMILHDAARQVYPLFFPHLGDACHGDHQRGLHGLQHVVVAFFAYFLYHDLYHDWFVAV
jgi:hypothetical protein